MPEPVRSVTFTVGDAELDVETLLGNAETRKLAVDAFGAFVQLFDARIKAEAGTPDQATADAHLRAVQAEIAPVMAALEAAAE
jgi:hypothetical protein